MSREKYDALVSSGIKIMQRIPLPDKHVPRNAHVEINAKISDGYHSVKWDNKELIKKLQKIETTRAKATAIYEMGLKGELHHFRINLDKCFNEVQESNMSKPGEDGKPIYNEMGKVMKGPKYFKPNLSKFIK